MTDEERAFRRALGQVLDDEGSGEHDLGKVYKRVSGRIQVAIRKRGDKATAFEVKGDIDGAFGQTFERRVRMVEGTVRRAGPRGAELGQGVLGRANVPQAARELADASQRIAQRTEARPTVPISTRIRRWDQDLGAEMAREVTRGIQQGRGILGAAREIQKIDKGYAAQLPQYLQRVEDAARAGNLPALKKLSKRYLARAKKTLGELQPDGSLRSSPYSLRSATTRFLRDVQKAQGEGIDKVVSTYVEERAQYQARLIARHESVEAMREAYVRESRDKAGVIGYRWITTGRHKLPDECDVFANQNLYELGPGVYPPDEIPKRHPSCTCAIIAVVDSKPFSSPANTNAPRDTKSPDGHGWLHQNQDLAKKILGPTRYKAFKEGLPVLDRDGRPVLVRHLAGRAAPPRAPVAPVARAPKPPRPVPVPKAPKAPKPPKAPKAAAPAAPKSAIPRRTSAQQARHDELVQEMRAAYEADDIERFQKAVVRTQKRVQQQYGLAAPQRSVAGGGDVQLYERTGIHKNNLGYIAPAAGSPTRASLHVARNLTRDGFDVEHVVAHEVAHTLGGADIAGAGKWKTGNLVAMDEWATETIAQDFVYPDRRQVRVLHQPAPLSLSERARGFGEGLGHVLVEQGSYQRFRQRLASAIAHAENLWDTEQLSRRVVEAAARWKSQHYGSADAARRALLEAVRADTPEKEGFYRKVLLEQDW